MKCPECEKELRLKSDIPYRYLDQYGGTVRVKTTCCNKIITLYRSPGYSACRYYGTSTEDDWGN